MAEEDPHRFGAEFGPKRTKGSTGVSLSTFKTLVWGSNLGGLLLFVIGVGLLVLAAWLVIEGTLRFLQIRRELQQSETAA